MHRSVGLAAAAVTWLIYKNRETPTVHVSFR